MFDGFWRAGLGNGLDGAGGAAGGSGAAHIGS
jgi:hypothetical protein